MTWRILPRAEYDKLAGTELETVWPVLPSEHYIIVAERGGAVVGCQALWPQWHLDGLWIAPGDRGRTSVARRLWRAVQLTASALGIRVAWTSATDDRVRHLLETVGATPVEGDHYLVPMKGTI